MRDSAEDIKEYQDMRKWKSSGDVKVEGGRSARDKCRAVEQPPRRQVSFKDNGRRRRTTHEYRTNPAADQTQKLDRQSYRPDRGPMQREMLSIRSTRGRDNAAGIGREEEACSQTGGQYDCMDRSTHNRIEVDGDPMR